MAGATAGARLGAKGTTAATWQYGPSGPQVSRCGGMDLDMCQLVVCLLCYFCYYDTSIIDFVNNDTDKLWCLEIARLILDKTED